jgi:hypothetical protein
MDIREILAINLRKLRQARGLSQEELAHRAEIDRTYISALERSVYAAGIDVVEAPPGGPGGASGASAYSPFFLRLRDQIRVKPSPSSSSNRLAKIGALKLGSSSLSER